MPVFAGDGDADDDDDDAADQILTAESQRISVHDALKQRWPRPLNQQLARYIRFRLDCSRAQLCSTATATVRLQQQEKPHERLHYKGNQSLGDQLLYFS